MLVAQVTPISDPTWTLHCYTTECEKRQVEKMHDGVRTHTVRTIPKTVQLHHALVDAEEDPHKGARRDILSDGQIMQLVTHWIEKGQQHHAFGFTFLVATLGEGKTSAKHRSKTLPSRLVREASHTQLDRIHVQS